MEGAEIRVRGRVQGVGFRPAVWRLAHELGLSGDVRNDAQGVLIRVAGGGDAIAELLERIRREPPPLEKPATLDKALWRQSQEWEIGLAIAGMILFALGIDAAMYLFAGFITH